MYMYVKFENLQGFMNMPVFPIEHRQKLTVDFVYYLVDEINRGFPTMPIEMSC